MGNVRAPSAWYICVSVLCILCWFGSVVITRQAGEMQEMRVLIQQQELGIAILRDQLDVLNQLLVAYRSELPYPCLPAEPQH